MDKSKLVVLDGGTRPEPEGDYIQQVFGDGGFLAAQIPGYRPRDGQIKLARAIDRGIRDGHHVIGEGPTGSGKSFAYSVPAVYHAVFNAKRVCIVTANKNLQRQIYQKDLADLAKAVPWKFTYAIRKGHNSYLCLRNLNAGAWQQLLFDEPDNAEMINATNEWAETTITGDFEESPGAPPKVWASFSTSREDCDGRKCGDFDDCFAKKARDRAASAQIIVTNYHLLFLHLKLGAESKILPEFDVVIMDECFPAGTLVGDNPIERIQVGELVQSYDEETGEFVHRRVVRVFASKPSGLVRLTIGARMIVCTPGHPFLTDRGWIPAHLLHVGSSVLSCASESDHGRDAMLRVRRDRSWERSRHGDLQVSTPGLLLPGARNGRSTRFIDAVRNGSIRSSAAAKFGTDAFQESHAQSRCAIEDVYSAKGDRASTADSRRQRNRPDSSAEAAIQRSPSGIEWIRSMGNRETNSMAETSVRQSRHQLLAGYREQSAEDRRRSRWVVPRIKDTKTGGCSTGPLPVWSRVDGIEVLESGSDGTYGGLCPDGLVYNLEVEGTHTYLVENVVVHNCHRAANIAREFFGQEVTFGQIYRCVNAMHMVDVRGFKGKGQELRDKVLRATSVLWAELTRRARSRDHILSQKRPLPSEPLEALLEEAAQFYVDVAAALSPQGSLVPLSVQKTAEGNAYAKLVGKCREKAVQLGEFRVVASEHTTYFIEGSGSEEKGKYVKLKSKAIEVGGLMRHALFGRYATTVQTSATLAVRGGNGSDFAYLRREMGMGPRQIDGVLDILEVEELVVESPFNWPKQALLVIPRSMPEFKNNDETWDRAVCDHFEQIVNAVRGRTLGLFTSFRMLQKVKEHLRATTGWRILAQGEATNRELAEQFQADVGSVLLGTESFSEGVSIEGEACSCVVLDKIPFLNQDDPVIQAIDHRLKVRGGRENVFQTHMLPEAIISFKQRVGRLIRTVKDVGVVVVLDRRLLTKPYRTQFLKSIPPIRKEEGLNAIGPFLHGVGAL